MPKTTNSRANLDRLVENAIDFLDHALRDLQKSPKYSVIHFHAAVELLLKARLLAEHWTLAISKRQDADLKRFLSGDFQSVTLEEAADRLDRVLQSPLTAAELSVFKSLAKHRNRMMHFHHEAVGDGAAQKLKKEVAIEQLRAWYVLNRLLLDRWGRVFKRWRQDFERVSSNLRNHRDYLQVAFEAVQPQMLALEAAGQTVEDCPACGFRASHVRHAVGLVKDCACAVCELRSQQATVPCPKCQSSVHFVGDGFATCGNCGTELEPEDLAVILDEDERGTKDYFERGMPAHCTFCNGVRTVVHHGGECVCGSCFTIFPESDMKPCDYCGDVNAGELEASYATGCVVCSGAQRYMKDD